MALAASGAPSAPDPGVPSARSPRISDIALTAIAPITWGTTYIVTTELLPPDRPLLASLLRALPAGLLLLAVTRRLPHGDWWWRAAVLGALNFGAFFPLLFYAAYRLPGGVAATIAAAQPLVVLAVAALVLGARPTPWSVAAALAGITGVGLMVLTAAAALDPLGVAAQLLGTSMMGVAIVLAKKWGRPEGGVLALTGWQLTAGGLMLAPLTLAAEGPPPAVTAPNLLGFAYLTLVGGVLAYFLWFRGIERLAPGSVAFLGLANPMTATLVGIALLGQLLTPWQIIGFAVALAALVLSQAGPARRPARPGRR